MTPEEYARDKNQENAVRYWSQPDLHNAWRVIAMHLKWDMEAVEELPYFLTPRVRHELGDLRFRSALEIGCGVGRLMVAMATEFREVAGVDITPQMVELSKEYLAKFPDLAPKISALVCDGKSIPVGDATVDFVYSMIVFQHLADIEIVRLYLHEAFRTLRKGGIARIQTFRGPVPLQWDVHWGRYFASSAAFAVEFKHAGFEVIEEESDLMFPDWIWVTAVKK